MDSDYNVLGRALTDMVESVEQQDVSTFTVVAGVVYDECWEITDGDAQLEELVERRYGSSRSAR